MSGERLRLLDNIKEISHRYRNSHDWLLRNYLEDTLISIFLDFNHLHICLSNKKQSLLKFTKDRLVVFGLSKLLFILWFSPATKSEYNKDIWYIWLEV